MRGQAQRFGGEQGERILRLQHVHHVERLTLQHAPRGLGHHAAVLDVEDRRTHHRLGLHVAADEGRQCLVAQRLVEIIGDELGEAALFQVLLRIAGHHDHRHVGLARRLAHAARDLQPVAVRQRQRGGDQMHFARRQRLARLGDAGAADHLYARQVALQHVGNQLADQLGPVHHHHAGRVADQMPELLSHEDAGSQVAVGRV